MADLSAIAKGEREGRRIVQLWGGEKQGLVYV